IEAHERAELERNRLDIDAARRNAGNYEFDGLTVTKPAFTGTRTFELDIAEVAEFIDWTPFFHSWGLRGRYPGILDDEKLGEAARPLWDDAQAMLKKIIDEQWFSPKAVIGFWPAHRDGDDIVLPGEGK